MRNVEVPEKGESRGAPIQERGLHMVPCDTPNVRGGGPTIKSGMD